MHFLDGVFYANVIEGWEVYAFFFYWVFSPLVALWIKIQMIVLLGAMVVSEQVCWCLCLWLYDLLVGRMEIDFCCGWKTHEDRLEWMDALLDIA